MIIRKGTILEMQRLWYQEFTTEYFLDQIQKNNAEFWAVEEHGNIIGELYLFKNLSDQDFADGDTTAYVCAFRIVEEKRGRGFGTELLKIVFDRAQALDFKYLTIGVDVEEKDNINLYTRLGFIEKIKMVEEDPCDVDENLKPVKCERFMLLRKELGQSYL